MQCSVDRAAVEEGAQESGSFELSAIEQVARFVFLMRSFVERLGSNSGSSSTELDYKIATADSKVTDVVPKTTLEKSDLMPPESPRKGQDNPRDPIGGFTEALHVLGADMSKSYPFVVFFPSSPLEDLLELSSPTSTDLFPDNRSTTDVPLSKRRTITSLLYVHLKAHPNNQDQLLDILDNYLAGQEEKWASGF
jgi:hypothetical protein